MLKSKTIEKSKIYRLKKKNLGTVLGPDTVMPSGVFQELRKEDENVK